MIGAFLIIIDLTPPDSGLVPLVVNRAVSSTIMFTVVALVALSGRSASGGWKAGIRFAIAIILAAIVLTERITPCSTSGSC